MDPSREPGAKAQIVAGLVAVATLVIQRALNLAPEDPMLQAVAPIVAYVAAQIAGLLWSRSRTTPVADPVLAEGKAVRLPDGTAAKVVRE